MSSGMDRRILMIVSWVFSIVGVGWFVWPIIGLIVDRDEPKLLTIFGVSWLVALCFLAIGSLLRVLLKREAGAAGRKGTEE